MPHRRILSLWFPRLAAERLIRAEPHLAGQPFAVVRDVGQMQVLASLSVEAGRAGLRPGQPLRDAHAMCAGLLTRPSHAQREGDFLGALHRWAGRYSPLAAAEPPDGLALDITGCAHLFGGEAGMAAQVTQDCRDLGLTVRVGLADTLGAAWALARYSAQDGVGHRSGDAIDMEAPVTRARAGKRRHWERGGAAPAVASANRAAGHIAAPGQAWTAISPLPVAALRIEADLVTQLSRLGLRRVGDLLGQPRAGLARRFGRGLVARMDQALGAAPEPVSPTPPPERFSARLSFPEPIGLEEDVAEAVSRLLEQVCKRLKTRGRGARSLRLEAYRSDHSMQWLTVTAAVARHDPYRLRPLITMKLEDLDAGLGIDMLRLEAVAHEPLHARNMAGHLEAAARVKAQQDKGTALEDLMSRIGARIGMDAITRRHPGDSHIPEKAAQTLAAAWSEPVRDWPRLPVARPLMLWRPEPVAAPDSHHMPERFRWRGRDFRVLGARGPERIAPEWWLDDPAWRSGARDYWRVETDHGDRLWLYFAHGGQMSSGWFCQGAFA